jgi:malonate decarboxylase gamma subunit
MAKTGGVLEVWDDSKPLAGQLAACLDRLADADTRDRLGRERGGRPKAANVAARVVSLATDDASSNSRRAQL